MIRKIQYNAYGDPSVLEICVTRPGGLAAVPHVFRRAWGVIFQA